MSGLRIAQLANFVGPTSGGMRTAIEHVGQGYVEAGAERIVITPGEKDVVVETELGTVVRVKSPKVSGGYRLITNPWTVIDILNGDGEPETLALLVQSADHRIRQVPRTTRRTGEEVDGRTRRRNRLQAAPMDGRSGRENSPRPKHSAPRRTV